MAERSGSWARTGLRARLTIAATALVALVLAAAAVALLLALQRSLVRSLDESARQGVADVTQLVASGQLPDPLPFAGGVVAQVVDGRQRVVRASPGGDRLVPLLDGPDLTAVRRGAAREIDAGRLGLQGRLRVVGGPAGDGRTVLVAVAVDEVQRSVAAVRLALLVGVPALVAAFALACWALVGSALRPVGQLRAGAEEITTARDGRRLPVPMARDEVRRLAETLNGMLDRLEAGQGRQRAFVADAAHELRSPLASIRTQLEVATLHPASADWDATAADVLEDVARLTRLVEDLLLLARLDDGPRAGHPSSLAAAASSVVDRTDGRVPVRYEGSDPAVVLLDADALARVVTNLVANAVRHARTGVSVSVTSAGGSGRLTVTDDGPGIAADEREAVFARFTRLDEARSADAGGSGLGLPIVRELVRSGGGTVRLEDAGPGLRVVVELPAAPPASAPPPQRELEDEAQREAG